MMSRIISIGTAVPQYGTKQSSILDYMLSAYNDDTASRKLNLLFKHSGISTRYSAVPDFNNPNSADLFFTGNNGSPTVEERLDVYKDKAVMLGIDAIKDSFQKIDTSIAEFEITHLITVTCTGIYAPGLDSELMNHLNLPNEIFHVAINFMGCNAAFHALKLSEMITKTDENAKVLIVCVELCTLHFKPKDNHDNLLSNTIFGDGASALIVTSEAYASLHKKSGLEIKGFYSILLNRGKDLMGWNINPVNFEMILDSKVPEFIGEEINEIVLKASRKLNIATEAIDNWAIHPGGKKILDTIKQQLHMDDSDLVQSYKVLNDYGNMSSPTILFVLNEILKTKPKPDETIFSIGFGPGISIETALFSYVG
jgi:predicted naringenin-chalcone synthase